MGCYSISMWSFTTSKLWCHYIRYPQPKLSHIGYRVFVLLNFVPCHFYKQGGVCMKVPRGLSRQMFQSILTFHIFEPTGSSRVCIYTDLKYNCYGTHRSRIGTTLLTHWPLLPNDRGVEDINQHGHQGFLWRRVRATQINIVNHSAGKF